MKMNRIFFLFLVLLMVISCGEDDGLLNPTGIVVPLRPLSEVVVENDAELRVYLETHFYNYEEFETPPDNFDFKIRISEIDADNSDKTPLMNQVETDVIELDSDQFGLDDGEENIQHTIYFLIARRGSGISPTVADSTFLRIEGSSLNDEIFQNVNTVPFWFDLPGSGDPNNMGFVRGFAEGVARLNAGGNVIENSDGTFSVEDYGIGAVFMPSALAFFDRTDITIGNNQSLNAYVPVLFEIDLFAAIENSDHDNDGIPSILEDIDGDGEVRNDNTDGDLSLFNTFLFNFLDPDDDNDGILTRDEIIIGADGTLSFPDTDGDGTPDYLDSDS